MWIKERIDAEHRKHKKLDWSKIAEQKILSQLGELINEWKNDLYGVVRYHKNHGDGDIISRSELIKKVRELKQRIAEEVRP